MKVSVNLKVSAKELFDVLCISSCEEAKKITGKEYTREDVMNGIKYKKKSKHGSKIVDATVHIKKPVLNKLFEVTNSTDDNQFTMRYQIEELGENLIKIEYTQEDNKGISEKNKFFFKASQNKRFKNIEKYLIDLRKQQEKENKK